MGRAITGNLEGKCWFGLQPSDFADRFGRKGDSSHLEYWFSQDDLETIEAELESMEKKNGEDFKKLDDFFDKNGSYTDEKIQKCLGLNYDDARFVLREYADYKFGLRLRDYLKENEECWFEVEL